MDEHRSARSVLQRALARGTLESIGAAAAAVDPAEVEEALAHVASCEECSRRFDVAETLAWLESREESHSMAQVPVDPAALFESALTAALSDPEALVRRRAAQRLGEMARLGAAAVDALVAAAGEDRDERVRAAALAALQRFDARMSLAQWVIDVWSAAPAEAARYMKSVLARLAALAGAAATSVGVTRLIGSRSHDGETIAFSGERGVRGRVARGPDGLWLTVEGLPPEFEGTRPVVAVPKALQVEGTTIVWAGGVSGLVAASESVAGGSLRVRLGKVEVGGTGAAAVAAVAAAPAAAAAARPPAPPPAAEAAAAASAPAAALFDQVYLLRPKPQR